MIRSSFEIAPGRIVGDGHPCYIIAEAGSNWRMGTPERDRSMARALIEVAAEAGCDCVKFQTYKAETVYVSNAGESDYLAALGIKKSIQAIFEDLAMAYEMLPELARYCRECKIDFCSTPFSVQDADAVNPYVTFHKLASYEISHTQLQERVASYGKPVIFSTGASEWSDVDDAVAHLQASGARDLAVMQCTAKYPAPLSSLHLRTIPALRERYGFPVGLSDHSREPAVAPMAAVALGAHLIEKHFTLHNRLPGADHPFALEPKELAELVRGVRQTEEALGTGEKTVDEAERELYAFARRGLQVIAPIRKGERFELDKNIAILRPGKQKLGVHPKHLSRFLAGLAARDLQVGEGLQFEHVHERS